MIMLEWPTVLGFLFLLPTAVGNDLPGVVTTSSDRSDTTQCGSHPLRICTSESHCSRHGLCRCPEGSYGNGEFVCYPTKSIRAEIAGAQLKLRTFNNTSARVCWPGRFRLTEFTTVRKSSGQICHFQVFGVNQILRGRTVLIGVEVHLSVTTNSTTTPGIGIRKVGKVEKGVFKYTEWGRNEFVTENPVTNVNTDEFLPPIDGSGSGDGIVPDDEDQDDEYSWGQLEELYIGGGERVSCEIDDDNFATVSVPDCSTVIRLRASNVDLSQQTHVPGLSVTITEGNGQTHFKNPHTYLAGSPFGEVLGDRVRPEGLRAEQEILHSVMEYAARQYSTPEGLECEDTALVYRSYCQNKTKKAAALNSCSFFLENPDLVSCMDTPDEKTTGKSINAFKLCLWHSCSPSQAVCELLKSRVRDAGCLSLTPSAFSDKGCYA